MSGLDLQTTLKQLRIPPEFQAYDTLTDAHVIARLDEWKQKASAVLSELQGQIQGKGSLTIQEQSKVVAAVAPFDAESPWSSETSQKLAHDILDQYSAPDLRLLEFILSNHIKTVFQKNPHPYVNPSTGRQVPRAAGDDFAQQDYYEGQTWKSKSGLPMLLSWCISHAETSAYEKLWHLLIPPIMTLLDDYEVRYKLQGIGIISELLSHVPPELLSRTGVDALLFSSLKTCLTFLHNPETPALLRAVIPTAVLLIHLTTAPRSAQRFDQLCAILGDSIIGGVWLYGTRDSETVQASLDALPELVRALGIGTARYLKAIIPQLTYPLVTASTPESNIPISLQLGSALALTVVIQECAPRVHLWKGAILDGVCRCWVNLADSRARSKDALELKNALMSICRYLIEACPAVNQDIQKILAMDAPMFIPLLVPSVVGAENRD